MPEYLVQLILIFALILANSFFAGSEIALVSARRSKIRQLAEAGDTNARIAEALQNQPERLLATVQVGMTVVSTLAGVIGGATIVAVLQKELAQVPVTFIQKGSQTIAIAIVVVSISYLTIVVGELVPKYIAYVYSETLATRLARPVHWISRIFSWAIKLLSVSSRLVVRAIGIKSLPESGAVSEEEIKLLLREGQKKGIFEKTEQELIHSVFEFTDTTVRMAMTPRTDIVAIDLAWDQKRLLRAVTEEGYSRYPVYQGSLDNVVGIIHTKDIINLLVDSELIILQDILRKPYFVPDSKKIGELLRDFQRLQVHLAIVLDEFGGTAGLITLEDILEEIVGEIQDEYDIEAERYVRLPDGSVWVAARLSLSELREILPGELPPGADADTIGGLVTSALGRIPSLSEAVNAGDYRFTIMEKAGHRITRVRVEKIQNTAYRTQNTGENH